MFFNLLNPSLISHPSVSEIVFTRRVSEGHAHVHSGKCFSSLPKIKSLGKDHSEILTAVKKSNISFAFLSGGYD